MIEEITKKRAYTVKGRWPFPSDMLRHDVAHPATPADRVLIDRMSGDESDPEFGTRQVVEINLVMEAGEPSITRPNGHFLPNEKRWRSFGWATVCVPEIEVEKAYLAEIDKFESLRRSGLAKLTPEKKRALGF